MPRRLNTDGSGAHLWLQEVVANPETQLQFAVVKQAIPPIEGLEPADLKKWGGSEYLQASYQEFSKCGGEGSGCRRMLAVSGLGASLHVDPCFDEIGFLLTRVVGAKSADEQSGELWGDEGRGCSTPLPESQEQAVEQLSNLLVEVSRTPFAEACR